MTLELRILSGSRAGANERFEKTVVAVGRHALSHLRFDPNIELDVSTKHAELRYVGGEWTLYDEGSTNGTFVNGVRVASQRTLAEGDVINFGANGPKVEVHSIGSAATASAPPVAPPTEFRPSTTPAASQPGRLDTTVRVAHAVKEQTRSMKRVYIGTVGALVAAGAIGLFLWKQQTDDMRASYEALLTRAESSAAAAQANIGAIRTLDTAYAKKLEEQYVARQAELVRARGMVAAGTARRGDIERLSQQISTPMDLTRVNKLNSPAVAFLVGEIDGVPTAGTGFGINAEGLIVTNKHVVRGASGEPATRVAVKLANTNEWLEAKIVRMSDTDDLALIQIVKPGRYPSVSGVSRTGSLAEPGSPIAQIGYPHANDTPMEGSGMDFTARNRISGGVVSKRLDDVLELDSYAGHGASGSPIFDTAGHVVGVVYGGVAESNGRIVLAVPAQRLSNFLGANSGANLR